MTFRPNILVTGDYKVYVWYVQGANRTTDAQHILHTDTGSQTLTINQQINGSQWLVLGTYHFMAGTNGYVRVTDAFTTGSVVMADAVKFVYVAPPAPPTITTQPQGRIVNQGASATFTVGATGAAPLNYQWRFEGTTISGATGSSYTRTNAQPSHEGDYSVVVTNVAGSATSAVAFLVVNVPPYIGVQPQSQTTNHGGDVTFFVTAGGTEPLSYQWRFQGTNIAGASESSYTRPNVQTNDTGMYSVVVTNVAGSVASSNATLTVTVPQPPMIQAISVQPGGSVRLTFSGATGVPYAINMSSNLTGWFELTNGILTNSPADFVDDSASNETVRFYRVRQ